MLNLKKGRTNFVMDQKSDLKGKELLWATLIKFVYFRNHKQEAA